MKIVQAFKMGKARAQVVTVSMFGRRRTWYGERLSWEWYWATDEGGTPSERNARRFSAAIRAYEVRTGAQ